MSTSMVGMVLVLSVGQGSYQPAVSIQLPKGAVVTISRSLPPDTLVFPAPPLEEIVKKTVPASVLVLPPRAVLTVRGLANRPFPEIHPGTPMIINMPAGGSLNVDPLTAQAWTGKQSAHPYAMIFYEPTRIVLELMPEPQIVYPPMYPTYSQSSHGGRQEGLFPRLGFRQ